VRTVDGFIICALTALAATPVREPQNRHRHRGHRHLHQLRHHLFSRHAGKNPAIDVRARPLAATHSLHAQPSARRHARCSQHGVPVHVLIQPATAACFRVLHHRQHPRPFSPPTTFAMPLKYSAIRIVEPAPEISYRLTDRRPAPGDNRVVRHRRELCPPAFVTSTRILRRLSAANTSSAILFPFRPGRRPHLRQR